MQLQSSRSVLRKVHNSYGSVTEFALQTRVRNWVCRVSPATGSQGVKGGRVMNLPLLIAALNLVGKVPIDFQKVLMRFPVNKRRFLPLQGR